MPPREADECTGGTGPTAADSRQFLSQFLPTFGPQTPFEVDPHARNSDGPSTTKPFRSALFAAGQQRDPTRGWVPTGKEDAVALVKATSDPQLAASPLMIVEALRNSPQRTFLSLAIANEELDDLDRRGGAIEQHLGVGSAHRCLWQGRTRIERLC